MRGIVIFLWVLTLGAIGVAIWAVTEVGIKTRIYLKWEFDKTRRTERRLNRLSRKQLKEVLKTGELP